MFVFVYPSIYVLLLDIEDGDRISDGDVLAGLGIANEDVGDVWTYVLGGDRFVEVEAREFDAELEVLDESG